MEHLHELLNSIQLIETNTQKLMTQKALTPPLPATGSLADEGGSSGDIEMHGAKSLFLLSAEAETKQSQSPGVYHSTAIVELERLAEDIDEEVHKLHYKVRIEPILRLVIMVNVCSWITVVDCCRVQRAV